MNIVTKHDVNKFLELLKAGLKNGKKKELKIYTNGSVYDGIDVVKTYFVNLEFTFSIDREIIDEVFADDDIDLSNQVDDLLKDI